MLKSHGILAILMAASVALTACDAPATETNGDASSSLPSVDGSMGAVGVAVGLDEDIPGSMNEGSPEGEIVTEQELPQSDVPPPSRDVFVDAECVFEEWVGKAVDEAAVKETGRKYRILKPGAMMTMDHNPQRINVEHDDNGVVTRVWCG